MLIYEKNKINNNIIVLLKIFNIYVYIYIY